MPRFMLDTDTCSYIMKRSHPRVIKRLQAVPVTDVCMSVPTLVGAGGAGQRLLVPVDDEELARLRASAEAIRGQARRLGF